MDTLVQFLGSAIANNETGLLVLTLIVASFSLVIAGLILERRYAGKRYLEERQRHNEEVQRINQMQEIADKVYDRIKEDNERLEKQIQELNERQESFEQQVKEAMSIGFDELKRTLENLTVKELIQQIPDSFKQDLQNEIQNTVNIAIQQSTDQMRAKLPTSVSKFFSREKEQQASEIDDNTQ